MILTVTSHKGGQCGEGNWGVLRRLSGVYRWRNVVNGKCYVGSAVSLGNRYDHHLHHLRQGTHRNPKLLNAWRKHGEGAFVFEVLETVEDVAHLVKREQHWMDMLGSSAGGYNINPRAGSNLGRVFGPEVRAKIAEGARRAMSDPRVKERHSTATRVAMENPEVKRRTAEAAARRWADPEYRAKVRALRSSPEYKDRVVAASKAGRARIAAGLSAEERRRRNAAMGESSCRDYAVISPAGETFGIRNLKRFCLENNIPYDSAICVVTGRMKTARGWVFRRIGG